MTLTYVVGSLGSNENKCLACYLTTCGKNYKKAEKSCPLNVIDKNAVISNVSDNKTGRLKVRKLEESSLYMYIYMKFAKEIE